MIKLARKLFRDKRGGAAIEYGLMCAFLVIAVVAAFSRLAGVTTGLWNTVHQQVSQQEQE